MGEHVDGQSEQLRQVHAEDHLQPELGPGDVPEGPRQPVDPGGAPGPGLVSQTGGHLRFDLILIFDLTLLSAFFSSKNLYLDLFYMATNRASCTVSKQQGDHLHKLSLTGMAALTTKNVNNINLMNDSFNLGRKNKRKKNQIDKGEWKKYYAI